MKIHFIKVLDYCRSQKSFWIFFIISTFCFLLWWLAFSPALMTTDSLDQWDQASTLHFSNWHPYLASIYFLLLRKIYDSPATIALFQIISTSLIFAYIFNYFLQKKIHPLLIWILFLMFCSSIPIGLYNITLWKDVPFSISLVFVSFLVSKSVLEKQLSNIPLLVLLIIISSFFRHNGIINLFIIPIIIVIYFYKIDQARVKKFLATIFCFAVILAFIVPSLIKVTPIPNWFTSIPIFYESVAYLPPLPMWKFTPRLTPLTIKTLEKIMPIANLINLYDPRTSEPLVFSDKISYSTYQDSTIWKTLNSEFWKYNLQTNFNFFVGNKMTLFITNTLGYGPTAAGGINQNQLGLAFNPLVPKLHSLLSQVANIFDENSILKRLVWNSLFAILLLIAMLVESFYKKLTASFIFALILTLNIGAIGIINVAGDWRYYYFAYLSFFISIPLYLLARKTHKTSSL